MRFAVMIQARCGSARLPGKVILDLYGKPMLQWMIERVRMSRYADDVIVVTSFGRENLPIVSLCSSMDVPVYCGSQNDVLDRYYQAARLVEAKYIIRLTADCPCFDAGLLDKAILTLDKDADYRGMLSETFADGLDLEIIKFKALEKAWREADKASEREHVTQYLINHPELFKLQDFVSASGNFGEKRWTVDEPEDFEFVKKIFGHFIRKGTVNFGYRDILDYLKEKPELELLNAMHGRNEGLQKSIANDYTVISHAGAMTGCR